MSDISDITLRIRVDIKNSAAILALVSNMNKVQGASDRMRGSMDRTARGSSLWTKAYSKVTGHLSAVERQLDAVFRAGVNMQSMGSDLLGFARSVGGAAKSLVDNWGEFQFTLNRAAAAADIFDTQSKLYEDLRAEVNKTAYELRVFPVGDVAKGLYFWQSTTGQTIKSQEDLRKTMANVTATMKVAAMTDTSYEQAIKGVYSTLKQFNLGMDQTANVSALLFYATQKTALEFPDLINSLKMTGAVAGNAREPLESMVAVLGAIGNAGIRGSQAGRALRQTYIKIVKPTKAAKTVLDDLFKSQGGYNKVAFDSKGNFIGIEKYVYKLSQSMKGLNYQQKANIIATITTANELPVMTQMIAAADRNGRKWVDTFADQKKAMDAFNGSWKNLEGSWKGVVGGLKNSVQPILQGVGKTIAEILTPTLNDLNVVIWDNVPAMTALAEEVVKGFKPYVEWVGKVIKSIMAWAAANPKIVKQIGKFAGLGVIFAGLAGAVLLAAGTFTFMLSNIILIVAGMVPLIAGVGSLIAIFSVLGVKIYQNVGGIQGSFKRFITAFGRVIKLFIFGTDGAKKGVKSLSDTINDLAGAAIEKIARGLDRLTSYLNRLTPADVQNMKNAAAAILLFVGINKGLNAAADAVDRLAKSYRGLYGAAKLAASAGQAAMSGTSKAVSGVETMLNMFASAAGVIIGRIAPAIVTKLGGLALPVAVIAAVIAALVAAYVTNFMGFKDFVDGIINWIVQNVVPVIQQVVQAIADFITGTVIPALQQFAGWLSQTFGPVIAQAGVTLNSAIVFFQTFAQKVSDALNWLYGVFETVWNAVRDVLKNVGIDIGDFSLNITGIFTWFTNAIVGIIGPWIDGIVNAIKIFVEMFAKVIEGGLKIVQGIFDVFTAILNGDWDGFWNGMKTIVDGIWKVISGLIDGAMKTIGNIIDTGLGIVDGIFKAIFGDGPDSIYANIKGFISTILEFGGNVIGGLVKGVGDAVGGAIDSVTGFFGDIIDGIKGFLGIHSPATIMLDIGLQIVNGLWKGINDAKDWIVSKITEFVKNVIPGPIRDALGIKSPSKVMAGIGKNIVDGLAVGIDKTNSALDSMNALTKNISNVAADASSTIGIQGGNISIDKTVDVTRRIELAVDVTSSDNSVDKVSMDTLASLITGSDMVRALERMSAVE